MLKIKSGSLYQILSDVYPEYEWLPWRFIRTPKQFWDDPKNQRTFLEWAGKQLKIKEMSDWYKVITHVTASFLGFCVILKGFV